MVLGTEVEDQVDLAVEQCFGGQFGTQAADVQADPRAVGGEPSQECRKDQQLDVFRRAEGKGPRLATRVEAALGGVTGVDAGEHFLHVGQHGATLVGRLHAAAGGDEQLVVEGLAQLLQAVADRRRTEVQVFGDLDEVLSLVDL